MRRLLFTVLAISLVFTVACTKKGEDAKTAPKLKQFIVGKDSVTARFVEQGSYTIPYWLEAGPRSAILVRISGYDGTEPVKDDALAGLKDMAEKGEYEKLQASGDTNMDGKLYGSPNTVYVAHRLGIVRELWWVAPTFSTVTQEELDYFKKRLKELYSAASEEIDGIQLGENGASGSINGVPVRILGLEQLKAPDEPVLLDIDGSFFQAMYRNENDTASLKFIAGMFKLLSQAGLSTQCVSISAAGDDGMASLKFRVFARYMERLLREPGMIDSKPPQLWAERADAWRAEQKDKDTAVPIYKNMIGRNPEDAASRYDLADLYFRLGRIEECATELEAAARLDRGYAAAFVIYRDKLSKAGQTEMAKRFYSRKPAG